MARAALSLAAVAAVLASTAAAPPHILPTVDIPDVFEASRQKQAFAAFKAAHGKAYPTADAEREALAAFVENDARIKAHNAREGATFTLGHNAFSDMSWEAFKAERLSGLEPRESVTERVRVVVKGEEDGSDSGAADPLPDSWDWGEQGCVTPVKDQGACGSCWAFSAVGAIEGAFCIATGNLVQFSEQELVSCDGSEYGCGGGLMDKAFEFVEENGLCTEEDDPYVSGNGHSPTCAQTQQDKTCVPKGIITGFKDVPHRDEAALRAAVAQQPVSVAIEADRSAFQLYKGGVFTSVSCGTQLDHGVLLVGYGTDEESGLDYWKVKNSWGKSWGEDGYIRIQRGKDLCGIALQASYPTGAKPVPGPAPGPPVPPPPPPAPAPKTHYGDPADGCLPSELAVEVQGVDGDFCSSKCVPLFKPCPRDKPAGVMAMPMCALTDQAHGVSYCALICAKLGEEIGPVHDAMCGPKMACQPISGVGICTYPEA